MVRLTDRPDMTLDVYRGRKTTMQQQQQHFSDFSILRGVVGIASDSRARGTGFNTRSGHIHVLSFLPLLKGSCQLLAKVYVHKVLVNR